MACGLGCNTEWPSGSTPGGLFLLCPGRAPSRIIHSSEPPMFERFSFTAATHHRRTATQESNMPIKIQ